MYPRRRDVREMLLQLFEFVEVKGIVAEDDEDFVEYVPYVDFDRDFLTVIRDLMRNGVSLTDAIFAIRKAEEEAEGEEVEEEEDEFVDATLPPGVPGFPGV